MRVRERRLVVAALLAAGWMTAPPPAAYAAFEMVGMGLSIDSCVDVDREELGQLADVEAAASDLLLSVRVEIVCVGPNVVLRATDLASASTAERSLRLPDVAPAARARLLALATVELAASVRAESKPPPTRAVAEAIPAAMAASPRADTSRAEWRLLAGGGGARFFSRFAETPVGGFRLAVDGTRFGASLDLQGAWARFAAAGATATVGHLSLSPTLGVHGTRNRFTFRTATGPRLALGRIQGEPPPGTLERAQTFTAPWFGWLAQLGVGASVVGAWIVELTIESGYVLVPIGGRINGQRAVAVEGPWLGAFLGVGTTL